MNDAQVIARLITALRAGLIEYGFASPRIKASYDTNQQGESSVPTWYIHRINTHKYGATSKKFQRNAQDSKIIDVTETRHLERTFQITALKKQDPENWDDDGAFDMVDIAAAVVESDEFGAAIRANGIQRYKVTDIATPYFEDASEDNQLSPNFNFTVIYTREFNKSVSAIDTFSDNINRL